MKAIVLILSLLNTATGERTQDAVRLNDHATLQTCTLYSQQIALERLRHYGRDWTVERMTCVRAVWRRQEV